MTDHELALDVCRQTVREAESERVRLRVRVRVRALVQEKSR